MAEPAAALVRARPGAAVAGGSGQPLRRGMSRGAGSGPASGRPEADTSSTEPFVETRAGGLFFLNAVLAAPALLVLWPVLVRGVLRSSGALEGPSPMLDPIPALAGRVGPWIAWLSVIPLVTTWRNLRMELPGPARWVLGGFVLLHAGVLAWWLLALAEGLGR